ncbi:hypothetical protein ELI_12410 [Erythrobacter litoralis HTCC2594]|uniref:Uncharacterized protein n=1 Tax=Erythrobacter litoralis (strain HTCC2594) TaxID=314225 RepID=Q2N6W7_ERYLH|nr:hypothetical protein ELI_12410 [Erythrobacter litoralis HTCC2594]
MGTSEDAVAAKAGSKLNKALTKRLKDSMLPGDDPFAKGGIEEAAKFVLSAAASRKPGSAKIAMASALEDRRYLRIAIVNDDMPFLVDSVAATIASHGLSIDRLVHPVLRVERDDDNRLIGFARNQAAGDAESMIYIETERADAKERRELEKALKVTLADVRAAVEDWPLVQHLMRQDAASLGESEGAKLLQWLNSGMLTQLGHVTRYRDGTLDEMLGICRQSADQILADSSYERAFEWFDDASERTTRAPLVVKANRPSNVHRRVPLDLFIVPRVEDGQVVALSVHAGVWTSAALAAKPGKVPVLRAHLDDLLREFAFDPNGHAGKALVHAVTTLPYDLTIGFEQADLRRVATTMMGLVDRPRPRLSLVEAPLARHLFAFAWMPRDMMSTDVRRRIQAMLERETGSQLLDWSLEIEGGTLAMLRFVLDIRAFDGAIDEDTFEDQMQAMLRGWPEAVETALGEMHESGRAAALAARYRDAFPAFYRDDYGPGEAAIDIDRLHSLSASVESGANIRGVRLYRKAGDDPNQLRLKVYQIAGELPLSDAVPALENFGFDVLSEIPTPLDDGEFGTIHDFLLGLPTADPIEKLLERAETVEVAIASVLNEAAENDPFNRLVVEAGLTAQAAEWLRAFYRYLRQTGMGFTIYTVVDALSRAPAVTNALIALFKARHDPAFSEDREKAVNAARAAMKSGLAKVSAINDDRLLRLYGAAIDATLRTNAFAEAGKVALAFKLDSAQVPSLPKPVPWREIFVYSRRVEGIHLRSGPVARGGLRWSDRRDDFRTEILGLMKAQKVKNAVIVPSGAKGGFYPKQLPDPGRDRAGWAAEGQASYEIFIETLLSITDNIVEGKVVHPADVVINDGEDPYFVVAADKGTARFSDIANRIAQEREFWLDDAFASGGSNGYDHKAMGITAKGAWVSVQRHFLEMGIDVQTEPVTVVGCGDMSGDVFGNGMLLSKAIKLVAAFDHRHIFIDPDPDPAKSWKERKRMFDLPSSSWEDYDPKLISKGGGVFPRSAKTIKLSKQARDALGIEDAQIEPDALISAILKSPNDLLWFGGIGTYIKAERENNIQVGDPANDALRVDGQDLRVKVIGEGANLGVTQAGRIEFALNGGRINTDFIDNSAGVDCSDNEVNIKIALADARRSGKLSEKKRVALLAEMTDEVAEIVLEEQPAPGAGVVDRGRRRRFGHGFAPAADRNARGTGLSRPPDRGACRQRDVQPPRNRRGGLHAARAGGVTVVGQAGAAGRHRSKPAARRSGTAAQPVGIFPRADAPGIQEADRQPPAAPGHHRHRPCQPHRQPAGPDPSLRAGGRGKRGACRSRVRIRRCRAAVRCARNLGGTGRSCNARSDPADPVRPRGERDAHPDGRCAANIERLPDAERRGRRTRQGRAETFNRNREIARRRKPCAHDQAAARIRQCRCAGEARGQGHAPVRSRRSRGPRRPCQAHGNRPPQADQCLHHPRARSRPGLGAGDGGTDEPVGRLGAPAGRRSRARLPADAAGIPAAPDAAQRDEGQSVRNGECLARRECRGDPAVSLDDHPRTCAYAGCARHAGADCQPGAQRPVALNPNRLDERGAPPPFRCAWIERTFASWGQGTAARRRPSPCGKRVSKAASRF